MILEYGYKKAAVTGFFINDELFENFENLPEGFIYCNESLQPLFLLAKKLGQKVKIGSQGLKIRIGKSIFISLEKWKLKELTAEVLNKLIDRFARNGEIPSSPGISVLNSLPSGAWKLLRISKREAVLGSQFYENHYFPAYRAGIISVTGEKGKIYKNISSYDMSSAYPAALLEFPFPIEESKEENPKNFSIDKNGKLNEKIGFIGKFTLTLSRRENAPISPLELNSKTARYFGSDSTFDRIGLVSGSVEIAASLPEMLAIGEIYEIEKAEIHEIHTHKLGMLGDEFTGLIRELYTNKKINVDDKLILNSIAGLTARNPLKEIKGEITSDKIETAVDTYNGKNGFARVMGGFARKLSYQHAIYMNSWVRLKMIVAAKAMSKVGAEVIYADTDSIKMAGDKKVVSEVFDKINKTLSKKLGDSGIGQWGDESEEYNEGVIFFEKRFYVKKGSKGIAAVMAGCDTEATEDLFERLGELEKIAENPVACYSRWIPNLEGYPERVYMKFNVKENNEK